jgi:hypothetical protein
MEMIFPSPNPHCDQLGVSESAGCDPQISQSKGTVQNSGAGRRQASSRVAWILAPAQAPTTRRSAHSKGTVAVRQSQTPSPSSSIQKARNLGSRPPAGVVHRTPTSSLAQTIAHTAKMQLCSALRVCDDAPEIEVRAPRASPPLPSPVCSWSTVEWTCVNVVHEKNERDPVHPGGRRGTAGADRPSPATGVHARVTNMHGRRE